MSENKTKISSSVLRMNKIIEKEYGLDLSSCMNKEAHLVEAFNHYNEKRNFLKKSLGEANVLSTPEYKKAYLISEALRMFLREIAPKRIKKRKKKNEK